MLNRNNTVIKNSELNRTLAIIEVMVETGLSFKRAEAVIREYEEAHIYTF